MGETPRSLASPRQTLALAALIVAAGFLAFANSLDAPFVFDDHGSILANSHILSLSPLGEAMSAPRGTTPAGRPVLALSLALNYQLSGYEVWSYRVVNISIHLLAGLTLFGVVRRTLRSERMRTRFGDSASGLGCVCALVWVLHPLQTSAVTYAIQRAESLMGLFYLLTLYGVIRSSAARAGSGAEMVWFCAALLSCALGMGTKEVMVTAPVLAVLYDRIFLATSWREVLRRRGPLYLGLAGTWAFLAALVLGAPRGASAGFGSEALLTPATYAATQFHVVAHYLALSFWPHPLVLDYGDWPAAQSVADVAPWAAIVLPLLCATGVALFRWPALGFAGAWFFLILAPTSSVVPIKDFTFDHRMYLSLAAPVAIAVLGSYRWGRKLWPRPAERNLGARRSSTAQWLGLTAALVTAITLGVLTHFRNEDYRSRVSIWRDTAENRPLNWRAHHNLALGYLARGEIDRALASFDTALELDPNLAASLAGRARAQLLARRPDLALADLDRALALRPDDSATLRERGFLRAVGGDLAGARIDLERSLRGEPHSLRVLESLSEIYADSGDAEQAEQFANRAAALLVRP